VSTRPFYKSFKREGYPGRFGPGFLKSKITKKYMRIIKFRVYKKETGIMYYPDSTQEEFNHYFQIGAGGFWLYDKEGKLMCTSNWGDTIMQFTGLSDKNGADIYEGDIIQFAEKYFYVVKFEDAKFVGYHANNDWGKWGDLYKLGEPNFSKYDYVVIGNIHNNPELVNPALKEGVTNTMNNFDPNTPQAAEGQEQATEQQNAQESASQDQAMEATQDNEEGSTEG
jgi:uncharacterized phage protein (TIGR01671 family)